jgi:hypothetical protein
MAKFDHCARCGKYDLVRKTVVENIVKLICLNCVYSANDRAPPAPQSHEDENLPKPENKLTTLDRLTAVMVTHAV